MNTREIESTCAVIRELWPRSKWAPAEWELLIEDMAGFAITEEQAVAVVKQIKRETKYPTPNVSIVIGGFKRVHDSERREQQIHRQNAPAAVDNAPDYYPGGQNMRTAMTLYTGGRRKEVHPEWIPVIKELLKYPGILRKYATAGGKS